MRAFRSLGLSVAILASAPALAQTEPSDAERYQRCMALVEKNPDGAFDKALEWQGLGGGEAAEHCLAAALFGLKQYREAGRRLEAMALQSKERDIVRVGLLAQAARAWLLADDPARSFDVLTAAIKLNPDDPDLLIDRAEARAAMKHYREAIDDLDQAVRLDPGRADAYVFRATAQRFLDDLARAEADAERALTLDPRHPEGLLERGILRRLKGDTAGARQDWLAVLQAAAGTAAADAAQRNIEMMDVKSP
ncbi:MAG: tetratricopeptide repeat protein [Rhodospirillales bacterium]|nr:tetratricopeptide repeat protein [Rhodospirillales bacterium]